MTPARGRWRRGRRWRRPAPSPRRRRPTARSAHAAARLVTRREVAEAYDDDAVRHAAFLADPGFYRTIVKHPLARRPGDGTARRSRLLAAAAHRHLRRLAGGCGSDGPVLYARLAPESPEALRVGEPGRERTLVEVDGEPDAALEELRDRYESAPWPLRAEYLEDARLAAARPRQEIFCEVRSSPYSERVTIGGPALARLREALSSVLPLWCLAAHLARRGDRDAARALGDLLTCLAARALPGDGGVIRLSGADVTAATAALWAGERPGPCLPGPDLMAVGDDLGRATWLLSGLRDDCRDLYEGLTGRLHPAPDVPRDDFLAHPGAPALPPPEIDLGDHTPRVMIDDLIYQRARWRLPLPGERGADPFDRWLALHRLCRERGLPRHAFVRHPADPRPLYVDFCDPLAVEDLARREPAEVLVTETVPGPGGHWWRVNGEAQCAELRLGCLVRPAPR
ncbi:hypothetical protein [Nonomuraea sp. NPDC050643]|uniref:hypothetical protein n=1 Tax=Nonomuraea sp. NPDC050643 TaxID=3155660 RepID=UPI0033D335D5